MCETGEIETETEAAKSRELKSWSRKIRDRESGFEKPLSISRDEISRLKFVFSARRDFGTEISGLVENLVQSRRDSRLFIKLKR